METVAVMVPRNTVMLALALALAGGACQEGDINNYEPQPDSSGVDAPGAGDSSMQPGDTRPADWPRYVTIEPADPKLIVEQGKAVPTAQLVAKVGSNKVSAKWTLDKGEYGAISASGLYTPSGKVGGKTTVTAYVGSLKGTTSVTVVLKLAQDGATKSNGNPGPGGFGGVGGEGLGQAVSAAVKALLAGTPTAAPKMTMLYPYDKTVWPTGILAPLLQWTPPPAGSGDGVLIELSSAYFSYRGSFTRPSLLASGAAFVRHPIPQDVWRAATRSAAGGTLSLKLTVASSGAAYGPLLQSWTVANGRLKGTVYYQSYGTKLAKNYSGAKGGDGKFGGATLAIKGGSTDPVLVAGTNGSTAGCRVCHSVSARGTRMVVQHGNNYKATSSYNLLSGYAEQVYPAATAGKLGWIGMTPDGAMGLGNTVPIPGGANSGNSALYNMVTGAVLTAPGLSTFVTRAGFPMFSPNGKRVAFNFYSGPGNATTGAGDGNKLAVMDFDPTTRTFSNAKVVYKGAKGSRPGWPAFWPTGKALLFQRELPGNTSGEFFATRYGGRGEIYWLDLSGSPKAFALDRLNGKLAGVQYLPKGPNKHDDDPALNYEPTISPIASGGYAWVVFMSRRMYGNVATINPWASDPREHDLTKAATPKKLWVAALDLNPKPGSDPSHPPFYLPAQELLAGNSRGFWVVDPCKPDGQPCEGGDECCNGYCIHKAGKKTLVCGKTIVGCAQEFDKCVVSTDCCNYPKFQCVNGHCARWKIN